MFGYLGQLTWGGVTLYPRVGHKQDILRFLARCAGYDKIQDTRKNPMDTISSARIDVLENVDNDVIDVLLNGK